MKTLTDKVRRRLMKEGADLIVWMLRKRGKCVIKNFGTFYVKPIQVPTQIGRTEKTGALVVRFRPSDTLKKLFNGR